MVTTATSPTRPDPPPTLSSGSHCAWTLEQRVSLWAANATAEQYLTVLGGLTDVLLRLQPTAWPLRLGPQLGFAWLTQAPKLDAPTTPRAYLLVGGTARAAVDLASGKYGSIELSAQCGGLLSDYSYRGGQGA